MAFLHQLEQFPLAHHRIGQVHAGHFVLFRGENTQLFDKPVIDRAVRNKFQRTDRVRDFLNGIRLTMGKIIHRVDAPFVARAVVMRVFDSVNDRITEVHIGRSHVDFSPQHVGSVAKLTRPHPPKQIKIFVHRPIPKWTFSTRFGRIPFLDGDFFGSRVVHVG